MVKRAWVTSKGEVFDTEEQAELRESQERAETVLASLLQDKIKRLPSIALSPSVVNILVEAILSHPELLVLYIGGSDG